MILVDSGFWVALSVESDQWHARALRALQAHAGSLLVTTWPVLTEASHLIAARGRMAMAIRFLEFCQEGMCRIAPSESANFDRIISLMQKYQDQPMDLADASLVELAERTGEGLVFSVDVEDFDVYRWKNNRPFRNLLTDF